MASLTAWQIIIKRILKSKQTQGKIRTTILEQCLYSEKKIDGAYQVDDNKVYEIIACKDEDCLRMMKELNIHDVIGLISCYEEFKYRTMMVAWPKKHWKKMG